MKQLKIFTILLIITLGFIRVNAADLDGNPINLKGPSNTWLGNFEIKELAPVTLNGEQMRTFELSYEKARKTTLIYLDERKNCRDYIVRSRNLEVCYACKRNSFGAKALTGKHMKYEPAYNERCLAQNELAKQQKIANGGLQIQEALGMIACYYPDLFKNPKLID